METNKLNLVLLFKTRINEKSCLQNDELNGSEDTKVTNDLDL
jgi:hypothetical protein